MPSTRKTWIIATALVAVILCALAWVFLLSPVREHTGTLQSDAETIETSNDILATRVASLREQYARIDELRAELAEFETHIPRSVNYRDLVEEIERAVDRSAVALLDVSATEQITPVMPYTSLQQEATSDPNAPAPAEPADGAPTTVSGAPPTATGALSSTIDGFYQIPFTITVQGDLAEVRAFSARLQEDSERAILVYAVSAEALDEKSESDSAPESEIGDVTYTLSALAYVLEFPAVPNGDTGEEEEADPRMPTVARDNPFAPADSVRNS